jgi:DNA end-binding protein Ku
MAKQAQAKSGRRRKSAPRKIQDVRPLWTGQLRLSLVSVSELIARKTAPFDPQVFHDNYTAALRALIEAKAKRKTLEIPEEERPPRSAQVIDLVGALKRSVQGAEGKGHAKSRARSRAKSAA